MESLVCSSSLPSKTLQNPHHLLYSISQFAVRKLGFSPPFGSNVSPVRSIFPKQKDPSHDSIFFRSISIPCFRNAPFLPFPASEQSLQPYPFAKSPAGVVSDHLIRKVLTAGVLVFLSSLIGILVHPVIPSPSYATVQTTVATGGMLVQSEILTSAWAGFFTGCLNTLSGPDHLAALTPLAIGRTWTESAVVGALWGCGHDVGQVIFGLLFLLLKDHLHFEVISTWGTVIVGLTLIFIGAMGIREALEVSFPSIALENGECEVDVVESVETAPHLKKKTGFVTFATGIVHGLQPDAFMMVLPVLALPCLAGVAFLGMFFLGTVFAMGTYTLFIASCSQALKDRIPGITEKLTWASSLIVIGLGIAILISQALGFSLY